MFKSGIGSGTVGLVAAMLLACGAIGCGTGNDAGNEAASDVAAETVAGPDLSTEADSSGEPLETPVPDVEAAARAFGLYYRERVERSLLAFNRFMLAGHVSFATNIGKVGVARAGNEWEIVPGPNDNNDIGVSAWASWQAWKIFRTRTTALAAIRMFNGLTFYEAVSGHPGMTARNVYPGWTRVVDGVAGTVTLTREGMPAQSLLAVAPELEAEMLAAFYAGVKMTYREDPSDILLAYMPSNEVGPYAVTYSFHSLPDFLRVSNCCASMKRTPAPYSWEGAYWSNHNSRDNFPDLTAGYVAALEAMQDPEAPQDLRDAAEQAWKAGRRVGDLIEENGGRIMTVDEFHDYQTLVVSGGVRPDGETEAEDLGSLSDCQMVFLARALSSHGLALPLPELPAPGSVEKLLTPFDECENPEPVQICNRIGEAYCGKDWIDIGELHFLGKPLLEVIRQLEKDSPGSAKALIGSFQDDFGEKTLAVLDLVRLARITGDAALTADAQQALDEITRTMRMFGELMYASTDPAALAERIYEAGLLAAAGGLEVPLADMNGFARAESQIATLESLPDMADTTPAPLKTDEEILKIVQDELAGASASAQQRYADAYGDTPPLRRAGDGYEARQFHDGKLTEWKPVVTHHHQVVGGIKLLEALSLCETAPQLLDCTWARLGCSRPDLDGDGTVNEADEALFEQQSAAYKETSCRTANAWCGGADLDRTGALDSVDTAFMAAAQGCRY
jgi:hypothetical protein